MVRMVLNGAALRTIRERTGLAQLALAEKSGVSQGRISELESLPTSTVRPATVKALAEALACDQAALITHTEKQPA